MSSSFSTSRLSTRLQKSRWSHVGSGARSADLQCLHFSDSRATGLTNARSELRSKERLIRNSRPRFQTTVVHVGMTVCEREDRCSRFGQTNLGQSHSRTPRRTHERRAISLECASFFTRSDVPNEKLVISGDDQQGCIILTRYHEGGAVWQKQSRHVSTTRRSVKLQ